MDEYNQKDFRTGNSDFIDVQPAGSQDPEGKKPWYKKGIWAALGGLLVVLFKFKFIPLLILSKLKFLFIFLKLGKLLSTSGSMLLMIAVYARIYGWVFAVGFVLLIFVHEMGHYLAAKYVNLEVSAPIFIPFLGAFISMKQHPADAATEAKVAMGGPLLGSAGALLCAGMYSLTGDKFFLSLAYTGFLINLFNLIPVHPLDGGRIVSAISPVLWLIGLPIMLVIAVRHFNPFLIMFLILGGIQAFQHWRSPNREYYDTPPNMRRLFAVLYFGLMSLLGTGMAYIHSFHLLQQAG